MRCRKPVRRKSAPPSTGAQEDLNARSRALYGVAQAHEPEATAQDNESIEDPLQDWPDEGDADRWLKERRGAAGRRRVLT